MADAAPPAITSPAIAPPTDRLRNHGRAPELLEIFLVNIVLTVLTLGVYRFWGKTRTRKYVVGHIEMFGDRFEYAGTGGELFFGFLKACLFFVPLLIVFFAANFAIDKIYGAKSGWHILVIVLLYVVFFPLGFIAAYTGRRYRLSRVHWRSIRFGQVGSPVTYAWIVLKTMFLSAVTLGLYFPFAQIARHHYVINNTEFGDRKFAFDGKGGDLFGTWVACWLLLLPTLGFSSFWYWAAEERYVFGHARCGHLRFSSNITGGSLLFLLFTNILLIMFTLGLGTPWAMMRAMDFVCERITLIGGDDLSTLKQNPEPLQKTGEGMLDLLDAGIAT